MQENTSRTNSSKQTLYIHQKLDAKQLAATYFNWLETTSKRLILIQYGQCNYHITFRLLSRPLLILTVMEATSDTLILRVTGGVLAKQDQLGTFSFKKGIEPKQWVISLDQFAPTLPWFIYKCTQAPIHELVMLRFVSFMKQTRTSNNRYL